MTNVLLLDDHNAITTGLKYSLEKSGYFEIKKILNSADHLIDFLYSEKIHLVITDINMPGKNIFEVIPTVKKQFPYIKIIVYTMFDSQGYFRDANNVGVNGYILKTENLDNMIPTVQNIMAGIYYCSKQLKKFLKDELLFNEKEHIILKNLLEGHKPAEIAKILGKSKRMVEYHLSNIRDKLGVRSNIELIIKYKDMY